MIELKKSEFKRIAEYIHENYGIFLRDEKQTLVNARLGSYLDQNNFKSFTDYFDYVIADKTGNAASVLIDKITTNYTYFMREPEHFNFMKDKALPYFEKTIKDYDLRIWSAGCATGEEPYTIAIMLEEYFKDKGMWNKQLLASDVSSKVLDIAKKGCYDESKIETLPKIWKLAYFNMKENNIAEVNSRIKGEVVFKKINFMNDSDMRFRKKFHIIFCRNVMIYFDNQTKDELVDRFYDLTAPGGYLFIGHTESLVNNRDTKYKYIAPAIYRKI